MGQCLVPGNKVSIVLHLVPGPIARTFHFWQINFFPRPPSPPPPLSRSSSPFSYPLLSRFVLLSSRVSFLVIYIRFCGSMARAGDRNKVSIIPHLGPTRRYENAARRSVAPRCVPPREYEECGSLVTHFPNSRIVLHPRVHVRNKSPEWEGGAQRRVHRRRYLWPRDRLVIAIAFRGRAVGN